jgi:hypothetical protein
MFPLMGCMASNKINSNVDLEEMQTEVVTAYLTYHSPNIP